MEAREDSQIESLLDPSSNVQLSIPRVSNETEAVTLKAHEEAAHIAPVVATLSPVPESATLSRRRRHPHLNYPHLRGVHWNLHVHTFDSIHYRNYRLLWSATAFTAAAFWLQQVIVGWISYDLTRSAFWTSLAMGLDALPMLLAGPLGGLLVEGWDRRKLLALVFSYQAVVTLGLFSIVLLMQVQTWYIFAFILLMGVSWAIADPARMSLIPSLVPKEHQMNAFALSTTAFSVTRLAAPIVGGVLLAIAGPGPALLVEAALQLGAVAAVLMLQTGQLPRAGLGFSSAVTGVAEGLRYVRGAPAILGLLLLAAVPSVLVMPFVYGLMPVYAAEVFRVGPTGLGVLMAAIGVGATIGTVGLASLGNLRERGYWTLFSAALMAFGMEAFSQIPWIGMALPALMLLSAGTMMFFALNVAMIQSKVKSEFRGRVSGLYMVTWGLSPVGSLAAGGLADRFGAPSATLVGAAASALALAGLAIKFKSIWKLRDAAATE